ncbi:hypothetical protein [Pyxidicoccus xibeiensis]|uniref:hypothetical protein n=1 Tax=Pyxidicoccus xibeiensis TaxID=2906759 RepID=UPI0020A7F482|nr:hypothetical protein [Pyxidicoccus xibeiensis]MCP3144077.1 hypothetical protein [Pyxidicoccus xibeiensis]
MMKALKMGLIGMALGAAAALGASTLGAEEASAQVCCTRCSPIRDQCVAKCEGDLQCRMVCQLAQRDCTMKCDRSC